MSSIVSPRTDTIENTKGFYPYELVIQCYLGEYCVSQTRTIADTAQRVRDAFALAMEDDFLEKLRVFAYRESIGVFQRDYILNTPNTPSDQNLNGSGGKRSPLTDPMDALICWGDNSPSTK
jgi:hypothetical protein